MRKAVYWIAEDGMKFESEEQCQKYEENMKDGVLFFDASGAPVKNFEDDDAVYLYASTPLKARYFYNSYCSDYTLPWINAEECEAGLWFWDRGEWREVTQHYRASKEIQKYIED